MQNLAFLDQCFYRDFPENFIGFVAAELHFETKKMPKNKNAKKLSEKTCISSGFVLKLHDVLKFHHTMKFA